MNAEELMRAKVMTKVLTPAGRGVIAGRRILRRGDMRVLVDLGQWLSSRDGMTPVITEFPISVVQIIPTER
jgi:hypothetical protein